MKKVFFLVSITMLILTSCGSKSSSAETKKEEAAEEITLESGSSYLFLTPSTEEIKIRFQEGESPYFEHYMLTGEDNQVTFSFYKAEDVTKDGTLKPGKRACRFYNLLLPPGEIVEEWGSKLVTIREDGSRHIMTYVLIDQPE